MRLPGGGFPASQRLIGRSVSLTESAAGGEAEGSEEGGKRQRRLEEPSAEMPPSHAGERWGCYVCVGYS